MIRQKRTGYQKYLDFLRDREPNGPRPQALCPSMTRAQADQAFEENDISRSEWTGLIAAFERKEAPGR